MILCDSHTTVSNPYYPNQLYLLILKWKQTTKLYSKHNRETQSMKKYSEKGVLEKIQHSSFENT